MKRISKKTKLNNNPLFSLFVIVFATTNSSFIDHRFSSFHIHINTFVYSVAVCAMLYELKFLFR